MERISGFGLWVMETSPLPSSRPANNRFNLAGFLTTHWVEVPPKPWSAFRPATPRDPEVMLGSKGTIFVGLYAREGGDPPKIPRSRRHPRSRRGQGRRRIGRAGGVYREVVLGRPGLSHKPGSGGALAFSPRSVSAPAGVGPAWAPAGQFRGR